MNDDEASRFGPRLYGLFHDLEDVPSVDNDQGEGDGPTLDEILQRMQLNGLDGSEQTYLGPLTRQHGLWGGL